MNWVCEIDDKLKDIGEINTETEFWEKKCIYKVAPHVTDLNRKAYRPQVVSFGPFHHGEEPLIHMEEHKHRALLHFLKRSKKSLQPYLESLVEVVQDLKDAYDPLDLVWQANTDKFLQLMILDGCFMLEILRTATTDSINDYAINDPIFSNHGKIYIMPFFRYDMLMLENQLPLLVLQKLLLVESDKKIESMIWEDPWKKRYRVTTFFQEDGRDSIFQYYATRLSEAGIQFKKSRSTSLTDISFHGGVIRLPPIVVDDATESMFLNQMAFERYHAEAGNEVSSYVGFMNNLIYDARDVSLLHSQGIIQNALGNEANVVKLFNLLTRYMTFDPENRLEDIGGIWPKSELAGRFTKAIRSTRGVTMKGRWYNERRVGDEEDEDRLAGNAEDRLRRR
ncbi:hypothetical protein LguiB_000509 [Lonicera macranthoides]